MTDLAPVCRPDGLRHGRERDRRLVAGPGVLCAGATVVALVRDEDPQSEFVRSGDEQRVTRVHGSLEDVAPLERSLVQYEVDVVFHLGAQTQVRHAQRQPWATMEANVRGTYNLLEAVHRVAPQVRALVVASSDKAYGESRRSRIRRRIHWPGGTSTTRPRARPTC